MGREGGGAGGGDPRQRRQNLTGGIRQELPDPASRRPSMSPSRARQRRRRDPGARRAAPRQAVGAKQPRQRSAQKEAVARESRRAPWRSANGVAGARPAKSTAQASTAWPVGVSRPSERPWPAGAERPGQSAFSWWCRCWRATLRWAISRRRWRTASSSASRVPLWAAGRPTRRARESESGAVAIVVLLKRREPSWVRAAWVSDGAKRRVEPGRRCSSRRPRAGAASRSPRSRSPSRAQLGTRSTHKAARSPRAGS